MRRKLITWLGGFPDIEATIEHIRAKSLPEKRDILTLAVKRLFVTIGPDDILHKNAHGQIVFQGRPLNEGEIKQISSEAESLRKMKLWEVLQDDIAFLANKKMFVDSKTADDLVAGKLMLYILDAINTRLKKL